MGNFSACVHTHHIMGIMHVIVIESNKVMFEKSCSTRNSIYHSAWVCNLSNSQRINQRSYILGESWRPIDFNVNSRKGLEGIRKITHIDYGYMHNGQEFPLARWIARVKVNSHPSMKTLDVWDLSPIGIKIVPNLFCACWKTYSQRKTSLSSQRKNPDIIKDRLNEAPTIFDTDAKLTYSSRQKLFPVHCAYKFLEELKRTILDNI